MNTDFYRLGIAPKLLDILESLNFKTPTPIQAQSIPTAIEGKDLIGIAQTGTGKTLAFGIPMIQRIAQSVSGAGGQGLIVVPTRELALQVSETLAKIGKPMGLNAAVVIGGVGIGPQIRDLSRKPNIIIATPGRLIDHLNQKTARLDNVSVVVLDEADRMLDMGFLPQIKKILIALPKERQTLLFSATMPQEITKIAAAYMKIPVRIEVAPAGTTVERVTQELFMVRKEQKLNLLTSLLQKSNGSTLVFSRTKFGAKKIVRHIRALGIKSAEIHSNRSLSQRREALDGFKVGKYRVLVATDIASRGIDVTGIEFVINYDLPSTPDDYVHRIGRTARAGASGHAITFASPDQMREVRMIERLIRKPIPSSQLPDLPKVEPQPYIPGQSHSHRSFHPSSRSQHSSPRPNRSLGRDRSRFGR